MIPVRLMVVAVGLVAFWQGVVRITGVPAYILPGPAAVARAILAHAGPLGHHAGVTFVEILSGLFLGVWVGIGSALSMIASRRIKRWLLPILVVSQAIPVFALAPLLVLWFGYGMLSKVAMAVLIIYFPVTATFYDGMRRIDPEWLELAKVMDAAPMKVIRYIRIPAALPALASGFRVATATAPIGAVVGEWVGSSEGLGFYMLHANARMQIDVMFAALALLAVLALSLYFLVDYSMTRIVFWQKEEEKEV
jgi:putative hydroxymethylpyrimidine transport system permease protein